MILHTVYNTYNNFVFLDVVTRIHDSTYNTYHILFTMCLSNILLEVLLVEHDRMKHPPTCINQLMA